MADLNSTLLQWNINHILSSGQHGLPVREAPLAEGSEFKCSFFSFRIAECLEKHRSLTKLEEKAWTVPENKPALHPQDILYCKAGAWGRVSPRPLLSTLLSPACFLSESHRVVLFHTWGEEIFSWSWRLWFIFWCSMWEQHTGSSPTFYWGQKFLLLIFSLLFFFLKETGPGGVIISTF